MGAFVTALRENPELAIFLTLALGFALGRIRIGSFALGNVVGTLLAGVLIGQLDIHVNPLVKIVFLTCSCSRPATRSCPQFFRGLKKNALWPGDADPCPGRDQPRHYGHGREGPQVRCGTAAGLMAGAFTESTVIGTAGSAISRLDVPEAEKNRLLNNIPVAYAVSYLVGTAFVVWFLVQPRAETPESGSEGREQEARGGRPAGRSPTPVRSQPKGLGPTSVPGRRRAVRGPERGRPGGLVRTRAPLRAADPAGR